MKWILAFSKPGQRNSYYCENGVPHLVLGQLIFISDAPLLSVICCYLVFDPLIHSLTWHTVIDYLHWMRSDHRSQAIAVSKKITALALVAMHFYWVGMAFNKFAWCKFNLSITAAVTGRMGKDLWQGEQEVLLGLEVILEEMYSSSRENSNQRPWGHKQHSDLE